MFDDVLLRPIHLRCVICLNFFCDQVCGVTLMLDHVLHGASWLCAKAGNTKDIGALVGPR